MTIKLEFIQVGLNLNVRRILWPNSQLLYFGIIVTFLSYHASDLHLIRKKHCYNSKKIFLSGMKLIFFVCILFALFYFLLLCIIA